MDEEIVSLDSVPSVGRNYRDTTGFKDWVLKLEHFLRMYSNKPNTISINKILQVTNNYYYGQKNI